PRGELVERHDDEEVETERLDHEREDRVQEVSDADASRLDRREVGLASEESDEGRDEVLDERVDDRSESGSDDDADREIDHVAGRDDPSKSFEHVVLRTSGGV